ncbi:MAG: phosphatidylglycerophosphatase A [Gammaproteobacteria bacterium]|nr:phosphatidylglycerophosphatase A [Gammaproteobacteria bacterium]
MPWQPKVISIFNTWFTNFFPKKYKEPLPPVPEAVWQRPLYFIAFGLGSGAMPFAPGTFGTLMAIPFYLLIHPLPLTIYLIFVLCFIGLSSWICEQVSREISLHDHPGMCLDEFAGFFVTMIHAPTGFAWILIGFLLFRLFDIWKPWPISFLDEKIHGGFGMVLDDIVAGIFAMLIIQLLSLI